MQRGEVLRLELGKVMQCVTVSSCCLRSSHSLGSRSFTLMSLVCALTFPFTLMIMTMMLMMHVTGGVNRRLQTGGGGEAAEYIRRALIHTRVSEYENIIYRMKKSINMMRATLVTLICVILSLTSTVYAADFLFVQTAMGATLNGTLTLAGVAEDVTYFSDRPERVAGRMSTEEFMTLFEPGGTFSEVYERANCTCAMLFIYGIARVYVPASSSRENVN